MAEITRERVETELLAYVRSEFGLAEEITRESKLVRTGLLDSVNLVQLATHLERTFAVTIPDQDIDAEHMETVAMIADYAMRLAGS